MPEPVTIALRRLRERAGLSMRQTARAVGYRGASSYQRYEDPRVYTEPHLPLKLVFRLADVLTGKGAPPITREEVHALAGLNNIVTEAPATEFAAGFAEDGAAPLGSSAVPHMALAEHVAPFEILSDAMDRHPLRLRRGQIALVDCSGETVENVEMGDAVVVQCLPRHADMPTKTLILQVVSPTLLVTNASGDNFVIRTDDPALPYDPVVRGRVVIALERERAHMSS